MAKKITVGLGEDGLPSDDVSHYRASQEQLRMFDSASEQLTSFKAPSLYNRADPHSHLLIALFDGTGNDVAQDSLHASNVATFQQQLRLLNEQGIGRLYVEYMEGPGTQQESVARTIDGALGRTSLGRAERMYERLVGRAQEIYQADPQAKLAVHIEGFSRGASQGPLLSRILDERGIPDRSSGIVSTRENGQPVYARNIREPGHTPISMALYDPVPTGYMEIFDRRPSASIVSGFKIDAANERRGLFPNDKVFPDGLSQDGRFLSVSVPGAHSDIGGTYFRGGIGIRSLNLMTDYHNRLLGEELIPRMHEPQDPRMNVIHRSEEGMALYRVAPKVDRATTAGQVQELTPDYSRYAGLGEVVHIPRQAPEALRIELQRFVDEAQPVERTARVSDPALTEGDTLAARLQQRGNVEFRPYEAPFLERPGMRAVAGLGVAGAAYSLYEARETGQRVGALYSQGNPLAAQSELQHYAARGVGGWMGGAAMGAAVGWETGPGVIAFVAVGAISTSAAADKVVDWLDDRKVYHQTDTQGVAWQFDGRAWTRPMMADNTDDGIDNPRQVDAAASLNKARELNYMASNAAASLAMGRVPSPGDPYSLPANETDARGIDQPNWQRDAATGQWQREITTAYVERGLSQTTRETATPERAAQLDAQSEQVILANIANSPTAVAARYEEAYQRSGFEDFGGMPDAIKTALAGDQLIAHDGKAYTRQADGQWRSGEIVAQGNTLRELESTSQVMQPALVDHAQAMASIPARTMRSPQEQQLEQLVYQYRVSGTELNPEWQQAVMLATQRTRESHGLERGGGMQLQRDTMGTYGADSPIAHIRQDAQGIGRIAAITTTEDIATALADVRKQAIGDPSTVPVTPGQQIEQQSPQERQAYVQALSESNRSGATPEQAGQIATMAAVTVSAPKAGSAARREEEQAAEAQVERKPVLADNPSHQDFDTFNRIHEWVRGTSQWDDEKSKNIASSLYREQAADPLIQRVDKVAGTLGKDGAENVFAVYAPYGDKGPFFHAHVDGREAAHQPAQQNLEQAEQIKLQQAQQQQFEQQQQREQVAQRGPSITV